MLGSVWVSFWCLFLKCFLGCFFGAQRVPKGSPKGSKIDEKEVSKRYLKKGPKKVSKMVIFRTPQCGASIVNNSKIDDFRVLVLGPFLVSFWGCFGSPNGGKKHEKVVPKSHSKTGFKNDRFFVDFGVPFGVENGAKNGLKTDLGSVRVARGSQRLSRGRFWEDF